MAEYKTIKGFKTQSYATDPVAATAAWSSKTAMNTSRRWGGSAQTAPTSAGQIGGGGPATSPSSNTEQYDGSTWSEVNNMLAAKFGLCGTGTQANAIAAAGSTINAEHWDGTCWSEENNLLTLRYQSACAGTGTTSALVAGGAPGAKVITETWNGTSWTETGDLGTARYAVSGGGTATAALAMGGMASPGSPSYANVEEFNGTSWTALNGLTTDRGIGAAAVTNTENALYFAGATIPGGGGGIPANMRTLTEKWNGTSWTETADLATGRAYANGSGTETAALCMGGGVLPPGSALTEEFNDYTSTNPAPSYTMLNEGQIWYNTTGGALKYTAATGAWASGPAMNTGRIQIASAVMSSTSSMMAAGGSLPGISAITELYDGTAWSETADLTTPRRNAGGCSTVNTAVVIAGGQVPAVTNICELWDGTSWTEVNDLNTPRTGVAPGGAGSSTAGLLAGDYSGPPINAVTANVEKWDGTSWTEVNNLNLARESAANFGTQTAAITAGGYGTDYSATTEEYDGTSWSEKNDINTARGWMPGTGTTTAGLIYAGTTGSQTNLTESWDGTSWTELADCATSRQSAGGGGGLNTSAAIYGGETSTATVNTMEEWSFSDVIKTVTVS